MDPGAAPRSTSPPVSSSSAASMTRSSPKLRLSGAAGPENTPKQRTGTAASTATEAGESRSAADSSGKTGGRLVIDALRLTASTVMPTTSTAISGRRRDCVPRGPRRSRLGPRAPDGAPAVPAVSE